MIYHIYWGTTGNAGLYLDEIHTVLAKAGYRQKAFVSRYYPFGYGEKVFFRYTDLEHGRELGKLRAPVRYMELIVALFRIYISILIYKPKVVNYSLIGMYAPVLLFLKLVKCTKCRLVLTCHDVIPFESRNQSHRKAIGMIAKAFKTADYLLVHNANSVEELADCYGMDRRKILQHRFPVMDLKKIYDQNKAMNKKYDFLFLGHLRKEKGIEVLLKAWHLFHQKHPDASLCIAGNAPYGFDTTRYEHQNIDFELHFLSDRAYFERASSATCIILPYTRGTNSGVVSTLMTLDVRVITSDIALFQNNELLDKEWMFASGKEQDLCRIMEMVYTGCTALPHKKRIGIYRERFSQEVIRVYSTLLEDKNTQHLSSCN